MLRRPDPLVCLLLLAPLSAQGRTDYLNVETPQVKPIAIANVAGHDYILACNTPDNSVEVWDTDESIAPASQRFVMRIPVGLEPGSVVWSRATGRIYTTDFLSDSVTCVQLQATSSSPATLSYTIVETRNVGDEPVHLAVTPTGSEIVVAFMSSHTIGRFDAATLQPIGARFPLLVNTGVDTWALREPRSVAVDATGTKAFVLGQKGGHKTSDPTAYDLDLVQVDLATGNVSAWVGTPGTTNSNLAAGPNGDLFVVSSVAHSDSPVATQTQPFVDSVVYRFSGFGTPSASVVGHDLNRIGTGGPLRSPATSFALPSDVAAYVVGGVVTKLFVAAMGSDRLASIQVGSGPAQDWPLSIIDIMPTGQPLQAGPRGLAFKPTRPTLGARIYVLNRLSNSIAIVDPATDSMLGGMRLRNNPTPLYVREGRPFLYSAKLSASGKVACASCHTDGRTDSLVWDLGSPGGFSAPFDPAFPDSPARTQLTHLGDLALNGFDPAKGPMVTQSLQGLLNYEIDPTAIDYTTNAPYHWRGDRSTFLHFNEGFANLLGLGDQFPGGSVPQGISPADMQKFEEFVNSIHYPPNPYQDPSRTYSGAAQNGLHLFLTEPIFLCGNRACVQCHALPEGSNNHMTETVTHQAVADLETAALRGLQQKDARLDVAAGTPSSIHLATTGDSGGMTHDGASVSVNGFLVTFSSTFGALLDDVRAFTREFDWGVAPIVGRVHTVRTPVASDPVLDALEQQANKANAGLVARGVFGSGASLQRRNFVFDPTQGLYVEQTTAAPAALARNALLQLLATASDQVLFASVPLGSERRFASPTGVALAPSATTPANLAFLRLRPNTAYRGVPLEAKNWIPVASGGDFAPQSPNGLPLPHTLHALRLMQHALKTGTPPSGTAQDFGLPDLRHDAARRFRVAGSGLQPGAVLLLRTPNDVNPPVTTQPPQAALTRLLRIPLFPSAEVVGGQPVWESAIELDPLTYYTMMLGGPHGPGVATVLGDTGSLLQEPVVPSAPGLLGASLFQPQLFNWHHVSVQNPGQTEVAIGWRRIELD